MKRMQTEEMVQKNEEIPIICACCGVIIKKVFREEKKSKKKYGICNECAKHR